MSARIYGINLVIAFLFCVYVLSSAGKFHIVDEVSLFAVTESLVQRGAVDTNAIAWTQWVNSPGEVLGAFGQGTLQAGQVYSKKGPAPAVLAAPWYLLMRFIARLDIQIGVLQGTLLWNGVVTALTAALLWLTLVRLHYGDATGLVMALLFGVGTIAWPYANHFFGEPLSALSLLTCFYALLSFQVTGKRRWLWLAGIGAALAVTTVVAHVLLVGALLVYWWRLRPTLDLSGLEKPDRSGLPYELPPLLVPLLLAGGCLLWYNVVRFGNPFDTGYHFEHGEGFTSPFFQGFWGLLISPYRGLFWYTPLFVLSLVAFGSFFKRHRNEALLLLTLTLIAIGLYSKWWMWWGGFAWGPRFLVPLTPFWLLPLAPWVERLMTGDVESHIAQQRLHRAWFWSITFLSCLVQMLAVSVNYVNYEIFLRSQFSTDWDDPLKYGPPAQRLVDWKFSPVLGQWHLWRDHWRANSDLAWLRANGDTLWLTLLVGAFALMTLGIALLLLLRAYRSERVAIIGEHAAADFAPSPFIGWIVYLAPVIMAGVWLGQTSSDPHFGDPEHGYRAALRELCAHVQPTDALITVAPYAYSIPMNWMSGLCPVNIPVYGYAADSLQHPEAAQALGNLLQNHWRIWLITGGVPANDAENSIERGLVDVTYKATDRWYDDYRLLQYATPIRLWGAAKLALDLQLFEDNKPQVTLLMAQTLANVMAGEIVPVEIHYQLDQPTTADLHWFVQLLSPVGYPVALVDTAPQHGYGAFSALPTAQELIERVALQLPDDLPPGVYQLIAGLYNPQAPDAPRLRLPNGQDNVDLGTIVVLN